MSAFDDLNDLERAVSAGRRSGDLSDRLHREVEAAVDPREVLRRVAQLLTATIADFCEIDVVAGDGAVVRLVAGPEADLASRREQVGLPMEIEDHPLVVILRTGESRLLDVDHPEQEHLFGPADDPLSARSLGLRTAILTRLEARGQVLGALSLGRGPSGRRFDADDIEVVLDVARRVAGAYHNALLLDAERKLTASLTALQRITADLGGTRSVDDVTRVILREAVPQVGADAAGVAMLTDDGLNLVPVAQTGLKNDDLADWEPFPVHLPIPTTESVRDIRLVEVYDRAELSRRWPAHSRTWEMEAFEGAVWLPLVGRSGVIGVLSLGFRRPRRLDEAERALLVAIAGQCAQALERAHADDIERHVSQTLQRQLLADAAVVHDRLTVSTRYVSAASDLDVGGDWYDVVALPDGTVAIAVGDVVGSGVEAAATMGQLRSALKALALRVGEPAAVLEALDQFASDTSGALGATVCYGVVAPDTGIVRLSAAGHPPPLLVSGGARFLEGPVDPPLGVRPGARRQFEVVLRPGDALLLYTDGLVERRGRRVDVGLERLRAAAAETEGSPPELVTSSVLAAAVGDDVLGDDVALLFVRFDDDAAERYRLNVPAESVNLRRLRHGLRDWLAGHDVVGDTVDDVVLAVSEAATNAIEHAYEHRPPPHRRRVELTAELGRDELLVEVRDAGRWKPIPSDTSRGRGLAMARAIMDDVSIHSGASGTVVSMRRRLGETAA